MKHVIYFLLVTTIITLYSCVPRDTKVITEVNLDLQDKKLQRIYDFQDKRMTDSLIPYFNDADPAYRYTTAMAFGSIQDEKALDYLYDLLYDDIEKVRVAAAYSIGQIGSRKAENLLIRAFKSNDTLRLFQKSNGAILEAIGKCGTEASLKNLGTISTYSPKDTALLQGQAWGIYRFGLRGITSPEGTQKMVDYATNTDLPIQPRFIAANYLYRAKLTQLDSIQVLPISNIILEERDPRIRMALAIAIAKSKSDIALLTLQNLYEVESDYRVKCNIIRALENFDYVQVQSIIFRAIKDKNTKVATTAAQFFYENGSGRDAYVYWRQAKEETNSTLKLKLYQVANKYMNPYFKDYKWSINNELKLMANDTTLNVYSRADAYRALGEYNFNHKFIFQNGFSDKEAVVRSAAVEAIAKICTDPEFDKNVGLSRVKVKKELSTFLSEAINKGDASMRYFAANVLSKPLGFKALFENSSFLHVAKRKLELPKETETLYAIQKAIDFFDDKETPNELPTYNHPLDWSLLDGINNQSIASIKTKKGSINLTLYPLEAPATVANFIKLANDGYYNGKNFHRIVPNFVIQGGCPIGDGFGSLDYSIRSELPMMYYNQQGFVGMASAGRDTEGVQFFITNSPTPHLDGKYTIFAKVKDGMNVVHDIEVGDIIESIKIIK